MTLREQVLQVLSEHDVIAVDLTLVNLSKVNGGGYITGYKPGATTEECLAIHDAICAITNTPEIEAGDEEWVCTCILDTQYPDIPNRFLRKGRDY